MPHPDPTLRIATMDRRELAIPHARRLAEAFFELDPSSRAPDIADATPSYDDWSARTARDRFELSDLSVLNKSMRARSPAKWWTGLFEQAELAWLAAVDPAWQLLMSDEEWAQRDMPALIEALMMGMLRKGIDVSVATKALHLKRPELVPVLDSLVIEQIGAKVSTSQSKRETRARQTRDIIVHLRVQAAAVREDLETIRVYLRDVVGKERTLVRVFDALLWSSHPSSLIAPVARLIERWNAEADDRGA